MQFSLSLKKILSLSLFLSPLSLSFSLFSRQQTARVIDLLFSFLPHSILCYSGTTTAIFHDCGQRPDHHEGSLDCEFLFVFFVLCHLFFGLSFSLISSLGFRGSPILLVTYWHRSFFNGLTDCFHVNSLKSKNTANNLTSDVLLWLVSYFKWLDPSSTCLDCFIMSRLCWFGF